MHKVVTASNMLRFGCGLEAAFLIFLEKISGTLAAMQRRKDDGGAKLC